MNAKLTSMLILGLALAGAQAPADDTNSDRPIKTHKQLMRECIAKQRAEGANASDQDLKKACAEEIKSYNNHPSSTSPDKTPQ